MINVTYYGFQTSLLPAAAAAAVIIIITVSTLDTLGCH